MLKNKLFIIIMLIIINITFVSASFEVVVNSNKNNIMPWETAEYTIAVTNKLNEEQIIKYNYIDSVEWSFIFNPIYTKRTIAPYETIYTNVTIMPINKRLFPKRYEFSIVLESESSNIKKNALFNLFLRDPEQIVDYVPIVNIDIDVPTNLDPRETGTIKIRLNNLNRLNISDYTVELRSKVNPDNNQIKSVNVKPLASEIVQFEINYNEKTNPQIEEIIILTSIPSKNKTYTNIIKNFEINPYSEIIVKINKEEKLLKTINNITIYNHGNIEKDYIYENPTTILKQFFSKSKPKYLAKKDSSGYKKLYWENNLKPFETKEIELIVNYRPFFIFLFIVLVGIIIYYIERTPLLIKKETKVLASNEGETTRFKVLLHIKNRTNKQIENLTIIDTVPKLLEIEKNFAIGTMHPSKIIKNETKGTIVKWQLPVLEPYEERIISYQHYSKLKIIGNLNMPPALAKFKNKRGNISRTYSNNINSK
jgi:hypothetical protein